MERIISATVVAQTTKKRPPSLTLTGARIFKQRLATIRKHRIGRESEATSQEPESSEQNMKNMTFRHALR